MLGNNHSAVLLLTRCSLLPSSDGNKYQHDFKCFSFIAAHPYPQMTHSVEAAQEAASSRAPLPWSYHHYLTPRLLKRSGGLCPHLRPVADSPTPCPRQRVRSAPGNALSSASPAVRGARNAAVRFKRTNQARSCGRGRG